MFFLLPFVGNSENNNLSNLSVVVEFKTVPVSVNVVHTPLKYNKDFALSFTMDDGPKDTYTHAFKLFTGGIIEGVNYTPKYYTDGCGNDINFTMSTAIYSISSYQDKDAHEPGSDQAILNVTWPEISEMYQKGFSVINHGFSTSTSADINYLDARNHSYIKYKTQNAIPGGIHSSVFINPNGAAEFTQPAFNQGYNVSFRMIAYGEEYLNVFSTFLINNLDHLEMGRRELSGSTSMATIVDELYNVSLTNPNTSPWASTFNHPVTGGGLVTHLAHLNSILNTLQTLMGKMV